MRSDYQSTKLTVAEEQKEAPRGCFFLSDLPESANQLGLVLESRLFCREQNCAN